ncbi:hypothetical protein Agub_g9425 [Astrephomene gubernaculifera]|uniref:O-fucosyltransferase family protein n=1 Tax=Astrephomene gubernaculifera TaxID=47775 RepID=A0AAD3DV51_9CHLO|nr:hypothetical protein Agub_g9425 [Astrephomene gubernaculifera]
MNIQQRTSFARRRRGLGALPSGPVALKLLVVCLATVGVSLWGVWTMGPYLFGRQRSMPSVAAEYSQQEEPLMVGLQTQTRGLLNLDAGDGTKYLMVQCHRGQFSNRLSCLQRGVLLARALQRVLVLPIFTDAAPAVDVSKYVSLECFRRNSQAVTFREFRERLCHGVGLEVPSLDAYSFIPRNASLDSSSSSSDSDSSTLGDSSSTRDSNGDAGGGSGLVYASGGDGNGSRSDGGGTARSSKRGGSFCEDGAMLQLESGYSLADYRGYTCWARREDITNARDLGVEIKRCTHVPPADTSSSATRYNLDDILAHFAHRPEKVLLFLDLFGVDLINSVDELARTVSEPGQMCGWMPTERAAAAADAVMQFLVPPPVGAAAGGSAAAAAEGVAVALMGFGSAAASAAAVSSVNGMYGIGNTATVGAEAASGRRNVLLSSSSSGSSALSASAQQSGADLVASSSLSSSEQSSAEDHPPPLRLRGARSYVAVHLRRSDWFYYCAGSRRCFYSMTEAGAWLNATLAARGMDTLYVSTNADAREKEMLRRAVSGNVLYWEDVLVQLRRWQKEAAAAAGTSLDSSTATSASSAAVAAAYLAAGGAPPGWLASLPLDDDLMVQMVEKAICMQAKDFVSSKSSTFSNQIRSFRNSGLEYMELEALVRKFGAAALPPAATEAAAGGAVVVAPPPLSPPPTAASPPYEPATFLCDAAAPSYPDLHRLPDFQNPNLFLEQARGFFAQLKQKLLDSWRRRGHGDSDSTTTTPASLSPCEQPSLSKLLQAPWRVLQRFVLVIEDMHAMAAANRFVEMYTGGAVVGLLLEGRQRASPAAVAECVSAAAAAAGAQALHVALVGVPADQQVLLMQALEARREQLWQVTRMGGAQQERGSTFTLLWRGDGLGRRAEPALLEELPTFLERTDLYVLAKMRVLLGDPAGTVFRQVQATRELFGFTDPRDGACAPEQLRGVAVA